MIGLTFVFTLLLLVVGTFLNLLTRGTIWVMLNLTGENLKDHYWNICSIWAAICVIFIIIKGDKK